MAFRGYAGYKDAVYNHTRERGVNINSHSSVKWIAPQRILCAFFWAGIFLLFTGVILLVTAKHKGM